MAGPENDDRHRHGNLVYYETLSKYKIQDDQRMTAGLEYRFND